MKIPDPKFTQLQEEQSRLERQLHRCVPDHWNRAPFEWDLTLEGEVQIGIEAAFQRTELLGAD